MTTGPRPARGHRVFAALYDRGLASAERGWLGDQRRALLAGARGAVLEIGAGTGANLRHIPGAVTSIVLTEPDPAMRRRLADRVERSGRHGVRVASSPAEHLDLPDGSVDTVVATLALCTVGDPDRALGEARRVLRPGGRLLFLEHVRGEGRRARWQDRVTPVWRRAVAGCHPNRDTVAAIRDAGFVVESVRITDDGPGLPLAKPFAVGSAVTPA